MLTWLIFTGLVTNTIYTSQFKYANTVFSVLCTSDDLICGYTIWLHKCVCGHTHIHLHTCKHIHIQVCTYTHSHTYNTYICTYTHIRTYMLTYSHTHMHIRTHTHARAHTQHTHTTIHTNMQAHKQTRTHVYFITPLCMRSILCLLHDSKMHASNTLCTARESVFLCAACKLTAILCERRIKAYNEMALAKHDKMLV